MLKNFKKIKIFRINSLLGIPHSCNNINKARQLKNDDKKTLISNSIKDSSQKKKELHKDQNPPRPKIEPTIDNDGENTNLDDKIESQITNLKKRIEKMKKELGLKNDEIDKLKENLIKQIQVNEDNQKMIETLKSDKNDSVAKCESYEEKNRNLAQKIEEYIQEENRYFKVS